MSENNAASNTTTSKIGISFAAIYAALLAYFLATSLSPSAVISTCHEPHDNLLIGYKILRHTLQKESELKYLKLLRQATFRASTPDVSRLMTKIASVSQTRGQELDVLWREEEPRIDLSKTPASDIGDAIQNVAETMGKNEMINMFLPPAPWSARFFILQGQATRMVAAMAVSLAERETNPQRATWLKELAMEYERLRDEVVTAVE